MCAATAATAAEEYFLSKRDINIASFVCTYVCMYLYLTTQGRTYHCTTPANRFHFYFGIGVDWPHFDLVVIVQNIDIAGILYLFGAK